MTSNIGSRTTKSTVELSMKNGEGDALSSDGIQMLMNSSMQILPRNRSFNNFCRQYCLLLFLVVAIPSISSAEVSIVCNKAALALGNGEFWKLVKPSTTTINENYLSIDLESVDVSKSLYDKTQTSAKFISELCTRYSMMMEKPFGNVSLNLDGEIKDQDHKILEESFKGINQALTDLKRYIPISLYLNSYGGDVNASLKIGNLLSGHKNITTFVGPESICASSCVLILAAGERKSIMGRVGIHRIRFVDNRMAALPKDEYREAYDAIMDDLVKYLKKMGIRTSLVEEMMQYSSDDIYYLSEKELNHYRLSQSNPYVKEQKKQQTIARCGNDWYQRMLKLDKVAERKCPDFNSENEYFRCLDSVYSSLYKLCR